MTPLRQQMIAALQRSGKGERTQEASVREVRLLAQCYGKSPALVSAQALQATFLHRKNVDGLAPASMRICDSGLTCFYQHVLTQDWHTLSRIRAQTEHRLPAILSVQEVPRLPKPLLSATSPSPPAASSRSRAVRSPVPPANPDAHAHEPPTAMGSHVSAESSSMASPMAS